MSDKSNKYGYVGVDIPEQSFGSNKGVFNPAEINELVADNKWTTFGQLELIETQSISGVSSTTFPDLGNYNVHFLTVNDFQPATDGTDLRIRFISNGTEYTGAFYQRALQYNTSTGSNGEDRTTTGTYLRATFNTGNGTNEKGNSYIYFYNLLDSSKYNFTTHHINIIGAEASTTQYSAFGSGVQTSAVSMDTIKLYNGSGNFTATASLYGIRYS